MILYKKYLCFISSDDVFENKKLTRRVGSSAPVRVFTGSDLITGSDRIGPDRARNMLFSSFLKHFFIIIMFIKNVYDHNNDVWIIKVGDDSYYLTGSGPKMV